MDTAQIELKMSHTGPDGGLHYWLSFDSMPVAYAKIYEKSTPEGTVVELCDIETREGHRNRGFATDLLERIAAGYRIEAVSHGGTYTADGFSYISSKLKRIGKPVDGPSWDPMGFVHDWDRLETKYS